MLVNAIGSMTDSINNRVISTKEELEAYRSELHDDIAARNPDRNFEVLFGDTGGGNMGFISIWLDGKGELV